MTTTNRTPTPGAGPQVYVITDLEARNVDKANRGPRRRRFRGVDGPPRLPNAKTVERLIAEQREREESRTLYRLRRHMYPHYVALALLGLAALAWLIDVLSADAIRGWLTLSAAALSFGTVGVVCASAWSNLPHRWRAHWVTGCLLGSTWLTAVTWVGPSWDALWYALAALVVGELAIGARWWRSIRIYGPNLKPSAPEVDHEADTIAARWDKYVGSQDGALPGSWLTDREETERAEAYRLHLHPGKHTFTTAVANLDRIASGVGKPLKHVILEPHPSGLPNEVQVKIVHRSPVDENVLFDRPRYQNGVVEIGPYADGEGEAVYRIYSAAEDDKGGSMHSGVVIGGTGSGKSRHLEAIGTAAMSTAYTVVWFLDPQGGSSSPALRDHADWYVDMAGAPAMLEAVKNVVYGRGLENAALDRTGFMPQWCTCVPCTCSTPVVTSLGAHEQTCGLVTSPVNEHRPGCRFRPGLLVIVDECHKVFTSETAAEWAGIVRESRKVGVSLVCASQYAGLRTFGGSEELRSSVMTGNAVAFFVASKTSGKLMAGLEVDPYTLPRIPGLGYTMATNDGGRTAPFKNRLILEPGVWMARQPRLSLDEYATRCAGPGYVNRHRSTDQIRQASLEQVEAIRSGRLSLEDVRRLAAIQAAGGGERPAARPQAPSLKPFRVPTFPTFPPARPAAATPGRPRVDTAGGVLLPTQPTAETPRHAAASAVLAALAEGATQKGDIQTRTGYSESRVRQVLSELIDDGQVRKVGHGQYALTARFSHVSESE